MIRRLSFILRPSSNILDCRNILTYFNCVSISAHYQHFLLPIIHHSCIKADHTGKHLRRRKHASTDNKTQTRAVVARFLKIRDSSRHVQMVYCNECCLDSFVTKQCNGHSTSFSYRRQKSVC
jgi:hypothetical protein